MKRPKTKHDHQDFSELDLNLLPERFSKEFPEKLADPDHLELPALIRLRLYLYLTPVFGFFPALWSLYSRQGSRQEQEISRLSVTLALTWLLGYGLLGSGVMQTEEILTLRLMVLSGLWSTGYVLLSLGLMVRVWQGKGVRLPGMSRLSEGWVRNKLS